MSTKTLKELCKDKGLVGKSYYRAIKRRQAGHLISTILEIGFIRHKALDNPETIHNKVYANHAEIERAFKPVASMTTVIRKVKRRDGVGKLLCLTYLTQGMPKALFMS